jgi:hypothetical protein
MAFEADSRIAGLGTEEPGNLRVTANRDPHPGDSDALNDFKVLLSPTFEEGVRWGAASLVA